MGFVTASESIDFDFVANFEQVNELNYSSATSTGMSLLTIKQNKRTTVGRATPPVLPCVRIWSDT